MQRHTLFCSASAGIAGSASVDLLGVPEMGECMMLIAVLGIFLAAAYAIFEVWGKPTASPETIVDGALAA